MEMANIEIVAPDDLIEPSEANVPTEVIIHREDNSDEKQSSKPSQVSAMSIELAKVLENRKPSGGTSKPDIQGRYPYYNFNYPVLVHVFL